jgi:RimJ/RimL family protein N-acetyltransferase
VPAAASYQPARLPDPTRPLAGERVRLEPIDAGRHASDLFEAADPSRPDADPRLWDFMSFGPFSSAAELAEWAAARQGDVDPLTYAIVDLKAGRAAGSAALQRATPEHGFIEIGHVWFGPPLQRTPQGTEAILLLLRHAFDELGYRRVEWKCDVRNARSRAAAERLGFRLEGVFRRHMIVKGASRDTAWYAIVDEEWPEVAAALERWLAPDNFDASGRQRRRLQDLRA